MDKKSIVEAVKKELLAVLEDSGVRTLVQLRSKIQKVFYRYSKQVWKEIKND